MFGFLIPRNYIEASEFDKANNNSKWYDATKAELDSIHSCEVFKKHEKAQYDKQKKVINASPRCNDSQTSGQDNSEKQKCCKAHYHIKS